MQKRDRNLIRAIAQRASTKDNPVHFRDVKAKWKALPRSYRRRRLLDSCSLQHRNKPLPAPVHEV